MGLLNPKRCRTGYLAYRVVEGAALTKQTALGLLITMQTLALSIARP